MSYAGTMDEAPAQVRVVYNDRVIRYLSIATIFWGLWLLPLGYLIYKSGYFPKLLGVLMIMAGFGYILDFFTHFLLPDYKAIFSSIVLILTMGEIIFMFWILLKGAKLPKE